MKSASCIFSFSFCTSILAFSLGEFTHLFKENVGCRKRTQTSVKLRLKFNEVRQELFVLPCTFCLDESLCFSLLRGLRWHFASFILNLAFCLMGGASASLFRDIQKEQTLNHDIYRTAFVLNWRKLSAACLSTSLISVGDTHWLFLPPLTCRGSQRRDVVYRIQVHGLLHLIIFYLVMDQARNPYAELLSSASHEHPGAAPKLQQCNKLVVHCTFVPH